MRITSTPFLFLFLPAVLGLYYLIPAKSGLRWRNLFLLFASLFFYTWGEPVCIVLLCATVFLTWCFGRMADGKKGTRTGKTAVFLTVVTNLLVILLFGKAELISAVLGQLLQKEISAYATGLPIGFSFFLFSSVSYVVDIYRGQGRTAGSITDTALYCCLFFRILQGPIVSYRKFAPQITDRKETFATFADGIWRFSVGLCEKVLLANTLFFPVQEILALDFSSMGLGDAWFCCITYLVYMYFDFAGYSHMAIGLGKMFGFSLPENFDYPYISASVGEFWRRWHITLCVWFTEYLYYPILLGPSVRLRKFLLRHNVKDRTAKTLQNIFVPASVWFVTSLWHGMTLNYAVWGLANCTAMLIEPHCKPLRNKHMNTVLRRAGLLGFLFLSMPLLATQSFGEALLFYKAMFSGAVLLSANVRYSLRNYAFFLLIGILGCFPVIPYLKGKFFRFTGEKWHTVWNIGAGIVMAVTVLFALNYILFAGDTVEFLYQQ